MSNNQDPCCKEVEAVMGEEDENNFSKNVHVPKFRPGQDHELLDGYHDRGIRGAKRKAAEFLSSNGSINRIRVRYKPKEVVAYFVQSEHEEGEDSGRRRRKRKAGLLVPGPGKSVFYVPEEQFTKFFEIIEDEGRIIA